MPSEIEVDVNSIERLLNPFSKDKSEKWSDKKRAKRVNKNDPSVSNFIKKKYHYESIISNNFFKKSIKIVGVNLEVQVKNITIICTLFAGTIAAIMSFSMSPQEAKIMTSAFTIVFGLLLFWHVPTYTDKIHVLKLAIVQYDENN
jgi:hypothetical protein